MNTRLLLTMFFSIFLVACGQDSAIGPASEPVSSNEEKEVSTKENTSQTEESRTKSTSESERAADTATEMNQLQELKIHYIDVGQADATLLQYSDGDQPYTILYDTGDWRGNEVVTYLNSQQVSYIDLVVVSHPDADHIGQLDDVMNQFDVGEVWLSGNESSSQTFQSGIEAVINSGADFHEPRTGEEYEIGPLEIDVLYPETVTGRSNEESISLLFTYGSTRFLFTGDATRSDELKMMNSGINVEADILHLGHHGSDTSSDPAFINKVKPSIAIYSAGEDNSYGHPSADVVSLIQSLGIELYGTDVNGTIVVTSDGEEYTIATKKDRMISPENAKSEGSSNTSSETHQSDTDEDMFKQEKRVEQSTDNNSCININAASIDKIQGIIHIGPERAQDLINLRPFQSVDDLNRISGIGPARIADIKSEGLACT